MDITPAPGGAQGTTGATGATGAGGATGAAGAAGTPVPTALWAARGSGAAIGEQKLITDIGAPAGTLMTWDGTYWQVRNRSIIIYDLVAATAGSNTNDNILKSATLPAGLLRACRSFATRVLFAKNNTAAAATAANIRLGSLGTIADPVLSSLSTFTSGSRSMAVGPLFGVISATTVRSLGNQAGSAEFTGSAITATYPQDITIEDIDATALILTASIQMSSGATLGQVGAMIMELYP